jgi:uncharacterized 2Fe-2S/4Fe-4S cluster protein (DUF4445 family)
MGFVVRFLPEDRSWHGAEPVPLSLAAAACDIIIEQPCGARASCGRCRVRVLDAEPAPDPIHAQVLGDAAVAQHWRLGCRVVLDRDATIEVPWSSRMVAHKTFGGDDLLDDGFEPARTTGHGIALDVGTTTLAAAVVAMSSGTVEATASALNPQVRFGADVMSRIGYAHSHEDGAAELHRALVAGLDDVMEVATRTAGLGLHQVADLLVVGNPTMLHALQRLPLAGLGQAPFKGIRYSMWRGDAAALGLALPAARACVLPGIAAHVGADAVAAILVTRLDLDPRPRLLLDFGTNTEVVLAGPHGILCTSAAAGPAFEGASIRHGMRAVTGAIEQVRITADGRLLVRTIDGAPATGICGSGLVDAVAELLGAGIIETSGRMRSAAEAAGRVPPALAARVTGVGADCAVRLSDGARPVLLTARDVRELQVAKGSIAAAVSLLLREARMELHQLAEVLLAGAFGNYVRPGSARALGLIPPVPPRQVRFVGNAAGAGARLALVDLRARQRAERLAGQVRFVELAGRADYQEEFVAQLPFPEVRETM